MKQKEKLNPIRSKETKSQRTVGHSSNGVKKNFSELARILGSRGGLARAGNMPAEKRTASARKAARIRWARERNGNKLRQQLKQELILTAKRKTMKERLLAYFVLSRNIALLSLGEKADRSFN